MTDISAFLEQVTIEELQQMAAPNSAFLVLFFVIVGLRQFEACGSHVLLSRGGIDLREESVTL